ncbi:BadF/BadG/BcrA/BcrD ATPase family protein [Streptomyces sp. NPDC006733]|uniref:N-acetylglucosamine kinase n=1 Tax=Streptomyces sp. NPDC006733 TaxID=3155460 RepID=UPI0033C5EA76
MAAPGGWVLGVDSGGSGVRVALARADGTARSAPIASKRPAVVADRGIDAASLLDEVRPAVRELMRAAGARTLAAAAVGAAGMATLGDDLRAVLPGALHEAFGVPSLALAADAVTAYTGALGMRPGVVVAAGTGMIALGTGLDDSGWRRADGWGHLLGDAGGGAWIGRAGLEAALRAHDGRPGGSTALLERAEALFGPVDGLPGQLYPRPDRPAVLASFAPAVGRCAAADPVAADILRQAARHILQTAAAVRPAGRPGSCRTALTGGLFKMGEPLLGPLRELAPEVFPEAEFVPADGDPLLGALRIAGALASGTLSLPEDPALLHIRMHVHPHNQM